MKNPADVAQLQSLFASNQVIAGEQLSEYEHYFHDASSWQWGKPAALVFAASQDDVVSLVKFCNEQKAKLSIIGGQTGYSGGANAIEGGIVLSLEKLNHITKIYPTESCIVVQPGVVTDAISMAVREYSLMYAVKFAASGSSHIGGSIATNAGGVHVIRYGNTRAQVLSLSVVTGSGEVLHCGAPVIKDNTGFSLKDLFIGSGGRLGVITSATLRLVPLPKTLTSVLVSIDTFSALTHLLSSARKMAGNLHAFEFFDATAYELVTTKANLRPLFSEPQPFYALVEWEAEAKTAETFLEMAMQNNLIVDGTISTSQSSQQGLWQYRERISETLRQNYRVIKFDVSIPAFAQQVFLENIKTKLQKINPHLNITVFGHLGDGNLHINVFSSANTFAPNEIAAIEDMVYTNVVAQQGSLSAEHGVGRIKEAAFRKFYPRLAFYNDQIKQVFDPNGVLL